MKSAGIREAKARLSELARAAAKVRPPSLLTTAKPVAMVGPLEQTTVEETGSDAREFRGLPPRDSDGGLERLLGSRRVAWVTLQRSRRDRQRQLLESSRSLSPSLRKKVRVTTPAHAFV